MSSPAEQVFADSDLRAYILGFCGRGHNLLNHFATHADARIAVSDLAAALERRQFAFVHYALEQRVIRPDRVAEIPPALAAYALKVAEKVAEARNKQAAGVRAKTDADLATPQTEENAFRCASGLAAAAGTVGIQYIGGGIETLAYMIRAGILTVHDDYMFSPSQAARLAVEACTAFGENTLPRSSRRIVDDLATNRGRLFGWPVAARVGIEKLQTPDAQEKLRRFLAGLLAPDKLPNKVPTFYDFEHAPYRYVKGAVKYSANMNELADYLFRFAHVAGTFSTHGSLQRENCRKFIGAAALLVAHQVGRGADASIAPRTPGESCARYAFDAIESAFWFLQKLLSRRFGLRPSKTQKAQTPLGFAYSPGESARDSGFVFGADYVQAADCFAPQPRAELLTEAAVAGAVRWLVAAGVRPTKVKFWPGAEAAELLAALSVRFSPTIWVWSPAAAAWLGRRGECDAEFFAAALRGRFRDNPDLAIVCARVDALCDAVGARTGTVSAVGGEHVGDFRTAVALDARRLLKHTAFGASIGATMTAETIAGWKRFPELFRPAFEQFSTAQKLLVHSLGRAEGWLTSADSLAVLKKQVGGVGDIESARELCRTVARDFPSAAAFKSLPPKTRHALVYSNLPFTQELIRAHAYLPIMLFNDRFLECIRAAEQQNVLRFSSPQSFSKAIAAVEHGSLEGMMSLQLLFAHAPAALRAEHVRTVFHTADAMAVLHGPQRRCDLVEYCTFFDSSTGGDSARFLCHLRWTQRNCPRCFLSLSRHCVRTPGSVQTLRDFVCAHEEKAKKLLEKLLPVSESFSRAYAAASATLPSHAEVVEAALAAAAASEQTMPENGAGRDSNRRRRA